MMVYEFTIAADYLPYIINGDASIFDYFGDYAGEEQEHLDWWLDKNTNELGVGHYSPVIECSDGELIDGFMTCDVTGAYCNCVLVEYVVM